MLLPFLKFIIDYYLYIQEYIIQEIEIWHVEEKDTLGKLDHWEKGVRDALSRTKVPYGKSAY